MRDQLAQAALLETIVEEQRERDLGVLLIIHDQTLAAHWCDRVIELTTAADSARGSGSLASSRSTSGGDPQDH